MKSGFPKSDAKSISFFVGGFFFSLPSLGFFLPLHEGTAGKAGRWGTPTTSLASHPLVALYMPQDETGTENPL